MANQVFTADGAFSIIGTKNISVLVDFHGTAYNVIISNDTLYNFFTSQGTTNLVFGFDNLPSNISVTNDNTAGLQLEPDGTQDINDAGWTVTPVTSTASDPTITVTYDDADVPTLDDPQYFHFPENSDPNGYIDTLSFSIDGDFSNPTIAISGGSIPDQYLFSVDNSGNLTSGGSSFDYEVPTDQSDDGVYTFNVTLTDDSGATVSAAINVIIDDVAEGPYLSYDFSEGSGTTAHDIANGLDLTLSGTPAWGSGYLTLDGSNDRGQSGTVPYQGTTTVLAKIRLLAYPANQALLLAFSQTNEPSAEYSTIVGFGSSGHLIGYAYDGSTRKATSSSTLSLNTWYDIAVTFENLNGISLYINNSSTADGTQVLGTQYNSWSSGPVIKVGGSTGGSGTNDFNNFLHADIADLQVFDHILIGSEIQAVWDAYPADSIAYTLTAAQGSFTLTGESANLVQSRILTAAQGAFSLTGEAAALFQSHTLAAAQGSFSLTGESLVFALARLVLAGQGSFALTGQDATFGATNRLTADMGSFVLTGQAANLFATRITAALCPLNGLLNFLNGIISAG